MKILLIFLLVYLIYRFLRNITFFTMRSRSVREDIPEPPASQPKQKKIIDKDEGEYVDYEEIKH